MHIHDCYLKLGVKKFYEENSESYSNPHAHYVNELLIRLRPKLPSIVKVLDVGCGDGLVTKILNLSRGVTITGVDKYMAHRYRKETGCSCIEASFEDISRGLIELGVHDVAICSYMVDIIPKGFRAGFFWYLGQFAKTIVTIRPNNHELEYHWLKLEDSFRFGKSCLKTYSVIS